LIKETKMK